MHRLGANCNSTRRVSRFMGNATRLTWLKCASWACPSGSPESMAVRKGFAKPWHPGPPVFRWERHLLSASNRDSRGITGEPSWRVLLPGRHGYSRIHWLLQRTFRSRSSRWRAHFLTMTSIQADAGSATSVISVKPTGRQRERLVIGARQSRWPLMSRKVESWKTRWAGSASATHCLRTSAFPRCGATRALRRA